jgi:hypothetical protein
MPNVRSLSFYRIQNVTSGGADGSTCSFPVYLGFFLRGVGRLALGKLPLHHGGVASALRTLVGYRRQRGGAAVSRRRSRREIELPWVRLPLSLVGGVALNALTRPC